MLMQVWPYEKLIKEHAEIKKALTRISKISMFSDQQTLNVQKAIVIAEECLEDMELSSEQFLEELT
jgi:hypothetical protein